MITDTCPLLSIRKTLATLHKSCPLCLAFKALSFTLSLLNPSAQSTSLSVRLSTLSYFRFSQLGGSFHLRRCFCRDEVLKMMMSPDDLPQLVAKMSLRAAEKDSASEIHIPADIDWHMLDKSKFFFLGAALFSGVSAALYPIVVLKTRQQVSPTQISCLKMSCAMMRHEGPRGFYRGFGTSLMGTIPARALYMTALEVTKSNVGTVTVRLGFSDTTAMAIANAAAGLSSAMAAQLVWTPIDVVSQRLMVQGCSTSSKNILPNGIWDINTDLCTVECGLVGFRTLFAHRLIWGGFGCYMCKKDESGSANRPDCRAMLAVQGLSAAMASGVSALITMPLDTVKTRLQVLDAEENGRRRPLTIKQTVRNLVREGGFAACYRGLGPRWASMSMSATNHGHYL
ncbi:hypothetical protein GBA52_028397 [Prunus armeniaca]|nr:hypothetical protein GBA52_028397 [Prunus armeniaca]